jgi:hypothetical protein
MTFVGSEGSEGAVLLIGPGSECLMNVSMKIIQLLIRKIDSYLRWT